MRSIPLIAALGAAALTAMPALAQEQVTDEDIAGAGEAAEVMMSRVYVMEPTVGVSPADVVAKLNELGYTEITDFDVEWDEYEIEATSPAGEDVEIEVDPVTGRIMEIEEDFW